MPRLIALYMRQGIWGFALSGIFVAMLLYFNVAHLWHLVSHAQGGIIAVIMLVLFNGMVFAGVHFAISIMRLSDKNRSGGGHCQPIYIAQVIMLARCGSNRRSSQASSKTNR